MAKIELGTKNINCPTHGEFVSKGYSLFGLEVWSSCGKCDAERTQKEALESSENRSVATQKERENNLLARHVPKRYWQATFENYKVSTASQEKTARYLAEYVSRESLENAENIIIHGRPGTGKTHLLWAMVKARKGVHYWTMNDILLRVKSSFTAGAKETEYDIINELAGYELLIIDEVGRQTGSSFENNFIFGIVDKRYAELRPTVLCTNLDVKNIADYIPAAALERINENSVDIICDWDNYRAKISA